MNRKTFFMGLLLASVLLFALCTDKNGPANTGETTSPAIETTTTEAASDSTTTPENIPLSDLQMSACDAADTGHTCQTKLVNLGIVPPDDCCKYLGKCCPVN